MYHVPELRVNRIRGPGWPARSHRSNTTQSTAPPLNSNQAARHHRLAPRGALPPGSPMSDRTPQDLRPAARTQAGRVPGVVTGPGNDSQGRSTSLTAWTSRSSATNSPLLWTGSCLSHRSPTIRLTVTWHSPLLGRTVKPLWRSALGEHRGHQAQQRPGEVVLGDHDIPVIHTKMVDSATRSWPIRQRDRQGPGDEILPLEGVTAASGVDHPALDGAIRSDLGHHDPHKPSLPLCTPESIRRYAAQAMNRRILTPRSSLSCRISRPGDWRLQTGGQARRTGHVAQDHPVAANA